MKKYLIFTVLVFMSVTAVTAVTVGDRSTLGLDNSLALIEPDYSPANQILLAPIFPTDGGSSVSPENWLRGIHYYSTVRMGYPDIPFHYVIFPDGQAYKLAEAGDEFKVNVEGLGEDVIIIAYLADPNGDNFDEEAMSAVKELTTSIANNNSIDPDKVSLSTLRFVLNENNKTANLEIRDLVGGWTQDLKAIKEHVSENYDPQPKNYTVDVTSLKVPEASVEPGQTVVVDVTVQNTGENTIYGYDTSNLLFSKEDGTLSKFYLNGVWASQSQVPLLTEEQELKPGEEAVYQIKFNVPLYFGEQSESFILKNALGQTVGSDKYDIVLNVKSVDEDVVEILETGTGYLNVRENDSGNAAVKTKVSPGERYILLKRGEYGYVQIQLNESETGWVSQQYVRQVN